MNARKKSKLASWLVGWLAGWLVGWRADDFRVQCGRDAGPTNWGKRG